MLELTGNQIREIPEFMVHLPRLFRLNVGENPLECPPLQVCEQGLTAIREYYQSIGN
jgi:hypothetical protein